MSKLDFSKRPLSWSALSSFEYSPEQWYRKYILNEKQESNAAMELGKEIGGRLASDPRYLPSVPRLPVFEHPLNVMFNQWPLIGYLDAYCPKTHALKEYKTGKLWTQSKANAHGQITMYCMMLHIAYKVKPEDIDCELIWLPTQENGDFSISLVEPVVPVIFKTKRDMNDIADFALRIIDTVYKMQQYCDQHV